MSFTDSLDDYARTHKVKDIEKIYYMELLYKGLKKGIFGDPLWTNVLAALNLADLHLPITHYKHLIMRIDMYCTICGVEWAPEYFEDAFWICPDCYDRKDASYFD